MWLKKYNSKGSSLQKDWISSVLHIINTLCVTDRVVKNFITCKEHRGEIAFKLGTSWVFAFETGHKLPFICLNLSFRRLQRVSVGTGRILLWWHRSCEEIMILLSMVKLCSCQDRTNLKTSGTIHKPYVAWLALCPCSSFSCLTRLPCVIIITAVTVIIIVIILFIITLCCS